MPEVVGGIVVEARVDLAGLEQSLRAAEGATRTSATRMQAAAAPAATGMSRALVGAERSLSNLTHAGRLSSNQMAALAHSVRSVTDQIIVGASPTQALAAQFNHLGYVISGPGGVLGAVRGVGSILAGMLTRFGPLAAAIGVVVASIAGMEYEINRASRTQVTFGNVFRATIQTVRDGIYGELQPIIASVAPFFARVWDQVVADFKGVNNLLIAGWATAFDTIKILWQNLPGVVGEATLNAVNNAIAGLNALVQKSVEGINFLIDKINSIPGVDIGHIGAAAVIPSVPNPFAGTAAGIGPAVTAAARENFGRDFLGEFFKAVRSHAIENAIAGTQDSAKKATGALSELGREAMAGLRDAADATNAQVEAARRGIEVAVDYTMDLFDQFFDGIRRGESAWTSLKTVALGVLSDIGRSILRSGISQLFGSLLGGAVQAPLMSGIPIAVAHSGWNVGVDPPPRTRTVLPDLLRSAPRLHDGLAPDEFPAILQRGETVTPRGQSAQGGGAVDVRISVDDDGRFRAYVENASGSVAARVVGDYSRGSYARHVANHQAATAKRAIR